MILAAATALGVGILAAWWLARPSCPECRGDGRIGYQYPTDYGTGREWDAECCYDCSGRGNRLGRLHAWWLYQVLHR